MLKNAYFLAKIGADTAENEQHFAEILPIGRRVADRCPAMSGALGLLDVGEEHLDLLARLLDRVVLISGFIMAEPGLLTSGIHESAGEWGTFHAANQPTLFPIYFLQNLSDLLEVFMRFQQNVLFPTIVRDIPSSPA